MTSLCRRSKAKDVDRVLKLKQSLPKITPEEEREAKEAYAVIYAGKKRAWCGCCGTEFDSDFWDNKRIKKAVCPHCGAYADIKRSSGKKRHTDIHYFSLIRVVEEYQVVRTFFCSLNTTKGGDFKRFWIEEVCQIWIRPDVEPIFLGRCVRGCMGGPCDLWRWETDIALKYDHYRFRLSSAWAKHVELHPQIRRNGFTRLRTSYEIVNQLEKMMNDHRLEVLAKWKQWKVVEAYLANSYHVRNYWDQLRICSRHKYIIKDPDLWMDLIDSLEEADKDTRNPRYICPGHDSVADFRAKKRELKKAHDRMMKEAAKRAARMEEMRRQERIKRMEQMASSYCERFGNLLDIVIEKGHIRIQPLQDIEDFRKEGETLNHCVYDRQYYAKEDTLILGARVDGNRTETIELNLKTKMIIQCRGKDNGMSKYHEEIMSLMKNNIQKYCRVI